MFCGAINTALVDNKFKVERQWTTDPQTNSRGYIFKREASSTHYFVRSSICRYVCPIFNLARSKVLWLLGGLVTFQQNGRVRLLDSAYYQLLPQFYRHSCKMSFIFLPQPLLPSQTELNHLATLANVKDHKKN